MALKKFDQDLLTRIFRKIVKNYATQAEMDSTNERIDNIVAEGGEPNVIEVVKQNGVALEVVDKAVDVTVPTKVSELENDADYVTADDINAPNPNILRGSNSCTELLDWESEVDGWPIGKWTSYDDVEPTIIEVDDAPVQDINVGWKLTGTKVGVSQMDVVVDPEKTYTMSCYCRGTGSLDLSMYDSGHGGVKPETEVRDIFDIDSSEWVQVALTNITEGERIPLKKSSMFDFSTTSSSSEIDICGMKLEEGSTATPWCPSYWDMENKNVDVPTKVSELENDAGYATTTQMESSIAELDILGNVGTSIPSESDLNDYTTAGKYYSQNSTVTSTLENCPFTGAGFALYVATNAAKSYYLQILTASGMSAYGRGRYFIRFYNPSGSNNNWIEVASSDDIPTKTSDLTNDSGYTALSYDEGEKTFYF